MLSAGLPTGNATRNVRQDRATEDTTDDSPLPRHTGSSPPPPRASRQPGGSVASAACGTSCGTRPDSHFCIPWHSIDSFHCFCSAYSDSFVSFALHSFARTPPKARPPRHEHTTHETGEAGSGTATRRGTTSTSATKHNPRDTMVHAHRSHCLTGTSSHKGQGEHAAASQFTCRTHVHARAHARALLHLRLTRSPSAS